MEKLSTQDTSVKQETINLTPEEKELYKEFQKTNHEITIMSWYKLRQVALMEADPGAKVFYMKNGILMDKKPGPDDLKEMEIKNMN